jgi:hypothetical protein
LVIWSLKVTIWFVLTIFKEVYQSSNYYVLQWIIM